MFRFGEGSEGLETTFLYVDLRKRERLQTLALALYAVIVDEV